MVCVRVCVCAQRECLGLNHRLVSGSLFRGGTEVPRDYVKGEQGCGASACVFVCGRLY